MLTFFPPSSCSLTFPPFSLPWCLFPFFLHPFFHTSLYFPPFLYLLPQIFLQWTTVIVHFTAPRLPEFSGEERAKAAIQAEKQRQRKEQQTNINAQKDNDEDAQTVTERMTCCVSQWWKTLDTFSLTQLQKQSDQLLDTHIVKVPACWNYSSLVKWGALLMMFECSRSSAWSTTTTDLIHWLINLGWRKCCHPTWSLTLMPILH